MNRRSGAADDTRRFSSAFGRGLETRLEYFTCDAAAAADPRRSPSSAAHYIRAEALDSGIRRGSIFQGFYRAAGISP